MGEPALRVISTVLVKCIKGTISVDWMHRETARARMRVLRAPGEEGTGTDQNRTDALLRKSCECRFEIAIGAGVQNKQLQAQRASPHLRVAMSVWTSGCAGENAEPGSIGQQLAEQLQFFRPQLVSEDEAAGNVRTGPVEAGDKTQCDRVNAGDKDDRYGRGRCLRRQSCGGTAGYDHRYTTADEIGCKRGQPVILIIRRTILGTLWPLT
jgi:hypothetical protein